MLLGWDCWLEHACPPHVGFNFDQHAQPEDVNSCEHVWPADIINTYLEVLCKVIRKKGKENINMIHWAATAASLGRLS